MTDPKMVGSTWKPNLNPEEQQRFDELRATIAPQISLIRKIRMALGMSQAELAEVMKMTQSAVSKMESKGETPLSVLMHMAEAKNARVRVMVETADGDEMSFAVG